MKNLENKTKKRKVLLIDSAWKTGKFEAPSFSLGYIGAVLLQNDINVEIIDFVSPEGENAKTISEFERKYEQPFFDEIKQKAKHADIVGITCNYGCYPRALKAAESAKKGNKNALVVIGGPFISSIEHFSKWQGLTLKDSKAIDVSVRGEGERTIIELADFIEGKIKLQEIKGITYRNRGKIYKTQDRELIEDINKIPFPAWSLFDLKKYAKFMYVIASRGCKYNCAFCDEKILWGRSFRYRNVDNLIDEIKRNISEFGITSFSIEDSTLGAYPFIEEFCDKIIAEGLGIKWMALCRVDEICKKDVLLRKMKKAGCVSIEFGIESGDNNMLNRMRKGTTTNKIKEAVKKSKNLGFIVQGSFIVGFPGETEESIEKTIKFAKKLKLDVYRWHIYQPSLRMLAESDKWGIVMKDDSWRDINLSLPNHLLTNSMSGHTFALTEQHAAIRAEENGEKVNDLGISYCGIKLNRIYTWAQKAMKSTKANNNELMVYEILAEN